MNLMTRKELCRYLAVSPKSSRRLLPPASRGSRIITETRVLDILNQGRVSMPPQSVILPTLMTPAQVAQEIVVNGEPVRPAKVLRWARRRKNPLPHFRITRNCLRFSRAALTAWLNATSSIS